MVDDKRTKSSTKKKKKNEVEKKERSSKKKKRSESSKKKNKIAEPQNDSTNTLNISPAKLSEKFESNASPSPPKRSRSEMSHAEESSTISPDEEMTENNQGRETDTAVAENKPLLNVRVHRMRHLDFKPRAILCMEPTPSHSDCLDYVAISRDGGSIELKSPDEKWRSLTSIAGIEDKPVNTMAWVCGMCKDRPRQDTSLSFSSDFQRSHTEIHSQQTLIGGSKGGTIFVLDFSKGDYSSITGSGGGGVFALSSLCGSNCCQEGNCPGLVAAGCEDSCIRIYKIRKSDDKTRLDLVSTLPPAGASILSLAWCRESESNGMGGTVIYAGVADGTIRRYECKSAIAAARAKGSIVSDEIYVGNQAWRSNIRMTVESVDRRTPTFVWTLKVLKDGTLVSGDSLGHVQFWDGKNGTLIESFEQNDKKADVLTIAVTPDGNQVFASGIDTRLICIGRPDFHNEKDGPSPWILAHAQRPHTHDVKAMCVCRGNYDSYGPTQTTKPQTLLCSGGVDTKICTFSVTGLKFDRAKIWFPWPTCSPISIAKSSRILLLQREKSLELHQIETQKTKSKPVVNIPVVLNENNTFIGTLGIKSKCNIICSDISTDGKYLVASTASTLLLFEVAYIANGDGTRTCSPKQIKLDEELKITCLAAKFLSNNQIICVNSDGSIRLISLSESKPDDQNATEEMLHTFASSENVLFTPTERVNTTFPVHSIAVSEDGKLFATVRGGVGSGIVSVFSVKENSIKFYWSLPALESPVTSVAFLSGNHQQLAVTCSDFATYVINLKERRLSDWSEDIGYPVADQLPQELKETMDFPSSVLARPNHHDKFIMASFGSFCVVSTSLGIPKRCRMVPENHVRMNNRTRPPYREQPQSNFMDPNHANFTMCMRYNSVIHTDFISEQEMIIVEQPWLSVLAALPEVLERQIFGT